MFYGQLAWLPDSFMALGGCRNTSSSWKLLRWTSETTFKIKPQQQYWTLGKLLRDELDHDLLLSSRAARWWLSMGQIPGHRNQIKNGKWNRGSKLSCYWCKLGLHLLFRNEEEGGRTTSLSVQQQAELGTAYWPCRVKHAQEQGAEGNLAGWGAQGNNAGIKNIKQRSHWLMKSERPEEKNKYPMLVPWE